MQEMFAELAEEPTKHGCKFQFHENAIEKLLIIYVSCKIDLGRTPALVSTEAASDNTIVWLLYWDNHDALHHYANNGKHYQAMKWYNTRAKSKGFHIGVMHEVYDVPRQHWETIYVNMKPFGLGKLPKPSSRCLCILK